MLIEIGLYLVILIGGVCTAAIVVALWVILAKVVGDFLISKELLYRHEVYRDSHSSVLDFGWIAFWWLYTIVLFVIAIPFKFFYIKTTELIDKITKDK